MAMSAEPQRKTAYSDDLRWRIVWLRLTRELAYQDVARSLCVPLGTVHNVWKKFMVTGEVTAKKQPPRESIRVLDHHHELFMIGLVLHQPYMYLREVCQYIYRIHETLRSSNILFFCASYSSFVIAPQSNKEYHPFICVMYCDLRLDYLAGEMHAL